MASTAPILPPPEPTAAPAPPERLTLRHVLADAYGEIVALDSPVLRTARDLTVRPGAAVRDYLERDRSRLVGPVKYAILTVTLLVLLGQAERALFPPGLVPGLDAARTHALYAAQDLRAYLIVVILVLVALAQWVLFRRSGFNFAECYAFCAYAFGHLVWLEILGSLLSNAVPLPSLLVSTLAVGFFLYAVCGFYRNRAPSVFLRGLVLYGIYHLGTLVVLQRTILILANGG